MMSSQNAIRAFAALSQDTRLAVFRLLIKSGLDGMGSGQIGQALGVKQNTMSQNLGILASAGLIRKEREGRVIRYFADFDGIATMMNFLMEDCCGGIPQLCAPTASCKT